MGISLGRRKDKTWVTGTWLRPPLSLPWVSFVVGHVTIERVQPPPRLYLRASFGQFWALSSFHRAPNSPV
ncbi:Uncharacterized protein TCM_036378 [Theobroma cacao]|uniref:Uncharacterized protein n=1 Tax=Theobroma cacao TaxID=3641 RepID=A0A061FRU8_THECC|nr:Uncharacterized protein TCM_036378 [Theobroma cacao]